MEETKCTEVRQNIQNILKNIAISTAKTTFNYRKILREAHEARSLLILSNDIKTMATEHEVPEINTDNYEELTNELTSIHEELLKLHAKLDKVLIRTKIADERLIALNKVDKIIRKYNNLS
jgi:hypothetical protein